MLMKNDVTDINPNEILHQMANELLMWDPDVKVVEKTKKDNCNGEGDSCECQDSDDEHGDNVEWWCDPFGLGCMWFWLFWFRQATEEYLLWVGGGVW